jgi:hypothetical protein
MHRREPVISIVTGRQLGYLPNMPVAAAWRGECRQRGLCPNPDLPLASPAAELLDAVDVHGRTRAPVPLPPLEETGALPRP